MEFIFTVIATIILVLCLAGSNKKRGFIDVIAALLYFPIGVILALIKKHK